MKFDPENPINQICAQGMLLEGEGKNAEARQLFQKAWDQAAGTIEKFTAAHYLARQQQNPADKLKWDELALNLALSIAREDIKATYPSLYLNVGKGHEDLGQLVQAKEKYSLASQYAEFLPDDGYGNMIRAGIHNGLERMAHH